MRTSLDSSHPIMTPSVRPTQRFFIISRFSRPTPSVPYTNSPTTMNVPQASSPRSHSNVAKSDLASQPQLASHRTALRFSTYAPSLTPTVQTTDSAHAEIRNIESGLARMENKALNKQRVLLSEEKTETFGKLALGAKLDRALDRRMTSQDAEMRPRKLSFSEKEKEAQ